ncbi:MAG: glycosyltransferase family 39 protein [Victivallaceae bacterium]|nr:glycosyltransferase family 39 protein [Victivallaceae bacterium]
MRQHSRKNLSKNRKFLLILAAIVLIGMGLRLGCGIELAAWNHGRNSVMSPPVSTDLCTYGALAEEILAGTFSGPFYYQPFYYAVFLPAAALIFGKGAWGVIFLQILAGGATIWLVGLIGAMLRSRRAGLIGAGITAISSALILATPFREIDTLQGWNLTFLVYASLMLLRRRNYFWPPLFGAMMGIGILTRGNIWLLVPGFLFLAAFGCYALDRNRKKYAFLYVPATAVALMLLVQLPFVVHNTRVEGKLSGPSTAGAAVLALGNTPEAPPGGRDYGLPAGPMEYPESYADFMTRVKQGHSSLELLFSWFQKEPAAVIELMFRKALLFWECGEIPNNISLYGEGEQSLVIRSTRIGRSGTILMLGLAGMLAFVAAMYRRHSFALGMLYHTALTYWMATAVFYILGRFRAPLLPAVAVFAGLYCDWVWRMLRERARRRIVLAALPALAAGAFVTFSANDLYREQCERFLMRFVRPRGIIYDLYNGDVVQLDHGPLSFGDWRLTPMKECRKAVKRFVPVAPQKHTATAELTIYAETPGTLSLLFNGKLLTQTFDSPGMKKLTMPIVLRDGELLEIPVISDQGKFHWVSDARRDYRRTLSDGNAIPGELVVRLRHTK